MHSGIDMLIPNPRILRLPMNIRIKRLSGEAREIGMGEGINQMLARRRRVEWRAVLLIPLKYKGR